MAINAATVYPFRFEPIYQYRLWGGRRLGEVLAKPLPDGPVGEAWVLSDRDDHASLVSEGPLKGCTIAQLNAQFPKELMGRLAGKFARFPLLLKFLDAQQMLSVQVHPPGNLGKTEAWVVLEAGPDARIFAGLLQGTSESSVRKAIQAGDVPELLESFHPVPGDAVFIPGGTVHSLGGGVLVFEVQQNSDTTYRLFDWDHIDPSTGKTRPLQIEHALEAIDFARPGAGKVEPSGEMLFGCDFFTVSRLSRQFPFPVGITDVPSVIVCTDGAGHIDCSGVPYSVRKGDVYLLPSSIGIPHCIPDATGISILQIEIPE